MSCARSNAAVWPTASVTSAKISGPLRRRRSRVTSSTPGTCLAAAATSSCRAPGTLSSRSSTDFFPSFRLTPITITATPRAATASAWTSQGTPSCSLASTPQSPSSTTADDQMSVEKCSASASSAWLAYLSAARLQGAGSRVIDHHRQAAPPETPTRWGRRGLSRRKTAGWPLR